MRKFLWLLAYETRFNTPDLSDEDRPKFWRGGVVAIEAAIGLISFLIAILCERLFKVHAIAAVVAAIIVALWQNAIHKGRIDDATPLIGRLIARKINPDYNENSAIELGFLLFKPLLVFILFAVHAHSWIIIVNCLAACLMLDLAGAAKGRQEDKPTLVNLAHWIVAIFIFIIFITLSGSFSLIPIVTLILAFLITDKIESFAPFKPGSRQIEAKSFYFTCAELLLIAFGILCNSLR